MPWIGCNWYFEMVLTKNMCFFLGSHFYVSAEGEYEVIKGGKILGRFESGKAFGELAVLYNCKRTASIKCKIYYLKLFLQKGRFKSFFTCESQWLFKKIAITIRRSFNSKEKSLLLKF